MFGTYGSSWGVANFHVVDGLTRDLLLGKHCPKKMISMFLTWESSRRSNES